LVDIQRSRSVTTHEAVEINTCLHPSRSDDKTIDVTMTHNQVHTSLSVKSYFKHVWIVCLKQLSKYTYCIRVPERSCLGKFVPTDVALTRECQVCYRCQWNGCWGSRKPCGVSPVRCLVFVQSTNGGGREERRLRGALYKVVCVDTSTDTGFPEVPTDHVNTCTYPPTSKRLLNYFFSLFKMFIYSRIKKGEIRGYKLSP
jgi:hypothetical protein